MLRTNCTTPSAPPPPQSELVCIPYPPVQHSGLSQQPVDYGAAEFPSLCVFRGRIHLTLGHAETQ